VLSSSKRMVKGMLAGMWPDNLIEEAKFETRASAKHLRSWLFERSRFRGKRDLKVNIGCGRNLAAGWVNIDLDGPPGTFRWDCRRGLPFDDGSVAVIFAEHVFEHFDSAAGASFLSECHRCLAKCGVVRLIVPDAGKYMRLYGSDWADIVPVRPLVEEAEGYRDCWLPSVYRTKMELINQVFRQGQEHKYAYDADTLILKMRDAGFEKAIEQQYGVSASGEAPLDSKIRAPESLYIEGIR
jgi:predicted SAM-dependent methyltransferase